MDPRAYPPCGNGPEQLVGEAGHSTHEDSVLSSAPVGATAPDGSVAGNETLEIDVGVVGDAQKYLNSGVITTDAVTEVRATDCIWRPLMEDLATVKPTAITTEVDCIATITAAATTTGTGTLTVVLWGVYNDPRIIA